MTSIFRYFSEKSTFHTNNLDQLLLNVSKTPIFIVNYLKYKRFGKWYFGSVLFGHKQAVHNDARGTSQ